MPTLWTIGSERLLPEALVAELRAAGIERLHVRSRPQSRRAGMSKTRHDGGSCFRSGALPGRDRPPRDRPQPRFRYEPETNGVVEKLIQIPKERVLWIERFQTLEQLGARVREFAALYNEHWLLERHGYRSPRQARAALTSPHHTVA